MLSVPFFYLLEQLKDDLNYITGGNPRYVNPVVVLSYWSMRYIVGGFDCWREGKKEMNKQKINKK